MLYFIGGAARTGKGILARRLLAEMGLPYLSLDVLKMGLARGAPEFPIDPNAGARQVAARLWPLVREMSASLLHDEIDYAFEGEIVPKDVHVLQQKYPAQIMGIFLGYTSIAPVDKLQQIRAHTGHPNDWSGEYSDEDLLAIIQREIGFSNYLQAECAKYDLPYWDTSQAFMARLDEVVAAIQEMG